MIGKSQYFLRSRMKSQKSARNDTAFSRQNCLDIEPGTGPGGLRTIQ